MPGSSSSTRDDVVHMKRMIALAKAKNADFPFAACIVDRVGRIDDDDRDLNSSPQLRLLSTSKLVRYEAC